MTMDTVSPALGVLIMMNNYFHDVATGLLVASGVSLYFIMRHFNGTGSRQRAEYFLSTYQVMTRIARFSFWWIIIAGVPRTYFYKSFEWANSVDTLQVPAIIIKHVMVLAMVGYGIHFWHKINRKAKEVRASLDSGAEGAMAS